jgi:dipeptidyl-peptidase-4
VSGAIKEWAGGRGGRGPPRFLSVFVSVFLPLPYPPFMPLSAALLLAAQSLLPTYPGHAEHAAISPKIREAFVSGAVTPRWSPDGASLTFRLAGKAMRYDFATGALTEEPPTPGAGDRDPANPRGSRGPARGRQYDSAASPDGALTAFHRDANLWLRSADGAERALTTDGSRDARIKYGAASWVYGEELGQRTAMWWSPDSTRLAYYRFDESAARDYHLALGQTEFQTTLAVEAYPKAGTPNPVPGLWLHDLRADRTIEVDVRSGAQFRDETLGHYVYGATWSPDGAELLFRRTDRRQQTMEFCAADPATGAVRVVVRESWPASWTRNSPEIRWLADGRRFVWASERSGWNNYYLYDLHDGLLRALTAHACEVAGIERVDEAAGVLWYLARSGDHPLKVQLHRVGLDGKGDARLTDPSFHHSVSVAPDGAHFTDVAQTHELPPVTTLRRADGAAVAVLAASDVSAFDALGLRPPELLEFRAADGVTPLYGMLHFPPGFDPARRYPLLVSVYAGPGSGGASATFAAPNALTAYGFLHATFDSRSAGGRGKRALDAIYGKLGVVEVDDQAAGVRALASRPYLDAGNVGIFGTSYGGYVSALCLLRHPDVFAAACASSAVTDWRHYDTIYTERYMGLPQDNPEGYDAGSAMRYAENLRGRLMIYYGTADDNVHPANALTLIAALQEAGKSFEVQVGPDRGHTSLDRERMMEFFIESLVLR